jgi:hypothetical protein
MTNAKTLFIVVALGLGLIFSSRLLAQEAQTGGLPALEDRVEVDEGLIAALTTRVTALETAVAELETDVTDLETLVAAGFHRLSAEYQNSATVGAPEIVTTVAPTAGGNGGEAKYTKTLSIPFDVVYITFSAQADTHGGAALAISANIKAGGATSTSAKTVCQPMAGGGLATAGPTGWMTLNKLPTDGLVETDPNNCNDGLGGVADCHDNAIMFSCCVLITPDTASTTHTVEIRLGSIPNPQTPTTATAAFYERSTIYIDAQKNTGSLCSGVNLLPH